MRIDCQSCGAAYAIDDNLIGDRGVRAQCPRCGAQKVVKKSDVAAAPADPFASTAPPPPADPFAQTMAPGPAGSPFGGGAPPPPFGAPAGAPPGTGFPPPGNPFGAPPPPAGPPPAPAASPFGGPPPAGDPFGGSAPPNPFGSPASSPAPNPFGGGPPPPAGNPFGAPGSGAAPNPFAGAPPPANPFGAPAAPPNPFEGAGGDPFGGPAPAANPFGRPPTGNQPPAGSPFSFLPPAAPAPSADPFGGPAAPSDDPFANLSTDGPARGGGGADTNQAEWRVRTAKGNELGPLTLDEVRQRIRSGEVNKDAQASQGGGNFRPITGFAPLAVSFRTSAGGGNKVVYRPAGGGAGRILAVVAGLLVLGGVGAGVYQFKDAIFSGGGNDGENIFERRAQMWRMQYPDLAGTADEHLEKGLKFFREDTSLGYRLAQEEFTKALCLDPHNLEAMGAYVENYAMIPPRRNDVETTRDALEGIEFAVKKNARRARLQRAHGALLLKMNQVEPALAALHRALALDANDAQAKLYQAQANLDRNVQEAVKLAEEAARIDPELKRTSFVLGTAYQKQGKFKTALNHFRKRLNTDPEHQETLLAIARLFVDVGDFSQAQNSLEKLLQLDGRNFTARLMLSKVLYQGLRDYRRAEGQLATLAASMGDDAAEVARDVYTHQAFVLAERGKWKEAEEAVMLALKDSADYGPALYVAGRVLAHRGATAEAREKLERAAQAVAGRYLEAPVRTALADVLAQQGQVVEAARAYTAVTKNDARYVRAYLGAASLYAERENMQQAAAMMREVLDIDPFHQREHFYFTDYPETPRDTERYRVGWTKIKPLENDRSIVLSSEGITAFHAEQYDQAERLLKRALADDRNNLAAEMYLGAVYLAKKRTRDATNALTSASRINKLHVRTTYLLARAYMLAGDDARAEEKLTDVRDQDPNFVAAVNALGELALGGGQDDRAKDYFLEAFKADQDYTPAKANLLRCNY